MDQFALQIAQVAPGGRRTIKNRMLARLQAIKMELRRRWHDPIKSCGDSRADLAASEGVYRTAEPIGYGHWHMP